MAPSCFCVNPGVRANGVAFGFDARPVNFRMGGDFLCFSLTDHISFHVQVASRRVRAQAAPAVAVRAAVSIAPPSSAKIS